MAFYGCSNLTSVTIPNSVTTIRRSAFKGCSNLTSVTMSNNVTSIGDYAFESCNNLNQLVLGEALETIGSKAFSNCTYLQNIYCYAVRCPTAQGDTFFNSYIYSKKLHVPIQLITDYQGVNPWAGFRDIIPLTDSDPKPTEIKNVKMQKQVEGSKYDLNGCRLHELQKGVNIIKTNDGKTKKVVIK